MAHANGRGTGRVVVGLGNPGPEYRDTRHNVGQRVLDALAGTCRASWRRDGPAVLGRGKWRGEPIWLIKPQAFMNESGPAVAWVLRCVEAWPADLILVYDDIDLPLGTVRVRMKGSAGGHNGVRSVIEALGTQEIKRVKVGIGRPGPPGQQKDLVVDHVLSPFYPDEREAVETACAEAALLALKLVETHT